MQLFPMFVALSFAICRTKLIRSLHRGHSFFELFDFFRVSQCKVCRFPNVGFQIVKFIHLLTIIFHCIAIEECIGFQILPLADADPSTLKIKLFSPGFLPSSQQWCLIDAIDVAILGDGVPSQVRKGWQEVDGGKDSGRRLYLPGPGEPQK